mgnify:CR=1 FL=1
MKPALPRLLLRAALALTLALASSASFAQATRTWVSGVGDDANPCSRTAPCKTFAGAFSATAPGGEISVLDPGGFGVVTITQSVTISGDGTLAGILSASTNAIIINAGASDVVTLRNRGALDAAAVIGGDLGGRHLSGRLAARHGGHDEAVGNAQRLQRERLEQRIENGTHGRTPQGDGSTR